MKDLHSDHNGAAHSEGSAPQAWVRIANYVVKDKMNFTQVGNVLEVSGRTVRRCVLRLGRVLMLHKVRRLLGVLAAVARSVSIFDSAENEDEKGWFALGVCEWDEAQQRVINNLAGEHEAGEHQVATSEGFLAICDKS